ncbi:glcNac-PIde-N-acetylase family [Haloferula helveola]|uniref:GlcNac-PIde-N-acetylase family n=1 Tax=Haloferula helveola TaxID=490095 RepID=A0ABM7R9L2_9BACT|nr:glcNac-PIde-N-acetylase family [Haloferula helveola]
MKPARFGLDPGPWDEPRRWLVLAPHPDDFEVVAVTMRLLAERGCDLFLEVLSGGASGVEDVFAESWEEKTAARESEQKASCERFGLPLERLKFHRLPEDEAGYIRDDEANDAAIRKILDRVGPEAVVLPHGRDSNADHRRVFRCFERWRGEQQKKPLALLVRDPKTFGMRLDLVTEFDDEAAEWKAELLRCHHSQHERNLRSRGIGFDERILATNREIGAEVGAAYAEGFEVMGG